MISTDLLLKGLAGVAVVGGASGVGIWYFTQEKTEELKTFADRVGLVCTPTDAAPTETVGIVCSKKGDAEVKVKKGTDSFVVSNLPATGGGKIKVYKDDGYNNKFKFVIEEGDIGSDNNKLEEFETYEIKEDEGKYHLTKKTDINAGIKKALGLPEGADCNLPTTTTEVQCDISGDKFKKIKFEGGDDGRAAASVNSKLKISKVEDSNTDYGNKYKFKFVLESGQDATISKTTIIKANTNTEFKIKATPATGSPKTLTLEKAWTLDTLRVKVGIDTCSAVTGETGKKECGFTQSKINLFNDSTNNAKSASLTNGDTSKKIKVEEEQAGYSQGFKFYVENADITLQNGSDKKIHKKETSNNSPTYEIKEQTITGGTKDWYLSKVTNPPGAGA